MEDTGQSTVATAEPATEIAAPEVVSSLDVGARINEIVAAAEQTARRHVDEALAQATKLRGDADTAAQETRRAADEAARETRRSAEALLAEARNAQEATERAAEESANRIREVEQTAHRRVETLVAQASEAESRLTSVSAALRKLADSIDEALGAGRVESSLLQDLAPGREELERRSSEEQQVAAIIRGEVEPPEVQD
ncbi:MAG: hypothetical protein ACKVUT_02795 [Gaiella sp.]